MMKLFSPPTEARAVARELQAVDLDLLAAKTNLEHYTARVQSLSATQRRLRAAKAEHDAAAEAAAAAAVRAKAAAQAQAQTVADDRAPPRAQVLPASPWNQK